MHDIRERLVKLVLSEIGDGEGQELPDDARLIEDLGYDSLQLMSIIAEIEKEFGITFDDSDMLFDNFNRIGDLYNLVSSLVEKKMK